MTKAKRFVSSPRKILKRHWSKTLFVFSVFASKLLRWTQTVHTCWTSDWQSTDSLTTDSFFQVLLITPFFLSLTRSWVYCSTLRCRLPRGIRRGGGGFQPHTKKQVSNFGYQKDKHQKNLWMIFDEKCQKNNVNFGIQTDSSVSILKFGYRGRIDIG